MNSIKILWNARGYGSKKEEITQKFREEDVEIGIVTEMKNKNNLNNKQKYIAPIPGYNGIIGNNYKNGQGGAGGVAIFVKKSIRVKEVSLENIQKEEFDCAAIMIYKMEENLAIIGIYRRPGKMLQQGRIKKILQKVKDFGRKECGKNVSIIIAGDFNAHHEMWNCHKTDRSGEQLLEDTEMEDLFIINSDTMSRLGSPEQRDSNIDLMFADEKIMEKMVYTQSEDTWGSDHVPIIFELGVKKMSYKKKTNRLSSKKTNWEEYCGLLEAEEGTLETEAFISAEIEEKYKHIIEKMKEAVRSVTRGINKIEEKKKREENREKHSKKKEYKNKNSVAWHGGMRNAKKL